VQLSKRMDTADLESNFSEDSSYLESRKRDRDVRRAAVASAGARAKAGSSVFNEEAARDEGRRIRHKMLSLNAYDRHKILVNTYLINRPGDAARILSRDTSRDRTDMDVVRENHRFIWSEEDGNEDSLTWEQRLAKKYWQKLYHEYCITDLSLYKANKVAMRFQTETEVKSGKGQFVCGARKCDEKEKLRTWEVNFAYKEDGEKKNALVKLRLCPDCSYKLNYHHKRKEVTKKKKRRKSEKKRKRKSGTERSDKKSKRHKQDNRSSASSSESSSDSDEDDKAARRAKKEEENEKKASEIWKEPLQIEQEKSREENFDEFLEDLFM